MSTDLVPLNEAIPSLPDADPELQSNFEEMHRSMTEPPKGIDPDSYSWRPDVIKICHKMTTDSQMPGSAEVGDVWSNGVILWSGSEHGPKNPFRFVPIIHWFAHTRFRQGETDPVCKSIDGKVGVNREGQQIKCAECPHLPWRNGRKQECDRSQNYYVFDLDNFRIRLLPFKSSSYSAGSTIISAARGKPALWSTVFGLSTKEKTSGDYTYPIYKVTPLEDEVPQAVFEYCDALYDFLSSRREEQIERRDELQAQVAEVLESDAPLSLDDLEEGEEEEGFDTM